MGYRRGEPVLRDLSLTVAPRGVVHVCGPNGSGKSTLVEVLSGYLPVWSGAVELAGEPASSAAARRGRRVCRSAVALYPNMSVRDHLTLAARTAGSAPEREHARAVRYGMNEWLDSPASALSAGNRRKVWLVMCTVGAFSTVILDEPFDGLDEHGIAVLHEEIIEWGTTGSALVIAHTLPVELEFSADIRLHPSMPGHEQEMVRHD